MKCEHCGSPSRLAQCCGLKVSSKPWTGVAKKVLVKDALATLQQMIQMGNAQAVAAIGQALAAKVPHNNRLVYLQALWAWQNGHIRQAYQVMQGLPKQGYMTAESAANLATLARQLNLLPDALGWIKQAVSRNNRAINFLQLGYDISQQTNDCNFASVCAEQLVKQQPDKQLHWHNWFQALESAGNWQPALVAAMQASEKFPTNSVWLCRQASIQERLHLLSEAKQTLEQALRVAPEDPFGRIIAARIQRREGAAKKTLRTLSQVNVDALSVELQKAYWQEQLLAQRALGAGKEALSSAANLHQLNALADVVAQEKNVELHLERISALNMAVLREQFNFNVPLNPVFIIGFPRCGSTLVEKLLFENFACINGDENIAFESIERDIYTVTGKAWWDLEVKDIQPELLQTLSQTLCAHYLTDNAMSDNGACGQLAVTDKNLTNLSRLPLLNLLFPDAPIIKVIRHPLDTVLSTYFNAFTVEHPWQQELATIARHYARLETHAEEVLANISNPVYTLHYEDVALAKQLPVDLMDFLHQHWHAEKRVHADGVDAQFFTRTASYAQVQAPVHNASILFSQPYVEFIEDEVHAVLAPYNQQWLEYWSKKGESNE
ncbi:tetratricopeptide repeat-containing sulfotransferase family protein [Alteromonas flava]|uniref:tetratricopeptide repeat-containing sulfotransferase family protein n=1 Tax=Alteromonas flava TaxID=2048003 RepID=UPI000C288E62|nr:sulfotransferase [Alteromonas flava]